MGIDSSEDFDGRITLDGDIDLQMQQIMSETRRATEATRQTNAAIRQSSGTTLPAVEQTTAGEIPTAGFVLELEKLANGLQDVAAGEADTATRLDQGNEQAQLSAEDGADWVKQALRDLWAQHATLTETVTRMHAVVADAEGSIDAFRDAMSRLEEATGTEIAPRERETPQVATSTHQVEPVASEANPGPVPPHDASSRRAALQALRSLTN